MTTQKIDQLLEQLQTELEQLELEAAAMNEEGAIALIASLHNKSENIAQLIDLCESIENVAIARCSRETVDRIYAPGSAVK